MDYTKLFHDKAAFERECLQQRMELYGVQYSEEEKRKSWENIFDITCSFDEEKTTEISTQATMWEIKLEWVKKVEYFKAR